MTGVSTSAGATASEKRGIAFYIHCAIGLFFMFIFGNVVEPVGTLTPVGMQILGVFIGAVYMWAIVNILWPAILAIIALGLTDHTNIVGVLRGGMGDQFVTTIIFTMILFGAVEHSGVARYISRWFLTRKVLNARPYIFSFVFIYCTFIISTMAGPIPAILMMWAILYVTLAELGYTKSCKYSKAMVVGVFFGGIAGQAAIPFTGSAFVIVGIFNSVTGLTISFAAYIIFGFIMATLNMLLYCLLMRYLFKPDVTKLASVTTEMFEKDALPPMNKQQKILLASVIVFLVGVMAPGLVPPGTFWITDFLNDLGVWGITMLLVVAGIVINVEGRPVIEFKEIIGKYVMWPIVFMFAAIMPLASALVSPDAGIREMIVLIFEPVLAGQSATGFSAITLVVTVIITQLANNVIVGTLMMPVIHLFGEPLGLNLAVLATSMIFVIHLSMLLPAATAMTPLLWGNREWVSVKDIMYFCIPITVLSLLMFIFVGFPLANFIFGFFG